MLSFELSAIDLILAVAVVILLILYMTKLSAKPPTEEKLLVEKEGSRGKPATEVTISEEKTKEPVSSQPHPHTGSAMCPFSFGYLGKLDKGASIPDGCIGCPRMMECYSANE